MHKILYMNKLVLLLIIVGLLFAFMLYLNFRIGQTNLKCAEAYNIITEGKSSGGFMSIDMICKVYCQLPIN